MRGMLRAITRLTYGLGFVFGGGCSLPQSQWHSYANPGTTRVVAGSLIYERLVFIEFSCKLLGLSITPGNLDSLGIKEFPTSWFTVKGSFLLLYQRRNSMDDSSIH